MRNLAWAVFALLGAVASAAEPALTPQNYLREMSPGINLGNTLEAIPTATSWGNPEPSGAYFAALRAAGFRSVRVPVAWSQYSDEDDNIDGEWMAHVQTTVKAALDHDLYVMINIHWDGGWMQPTAEAEPQVRHRFGSFWRQIATAFSDFDERLLFAGTNEIHVEGEYGPPTEENARVQNGFNQLFVDTVRATGGRNRDRWLVVQGYNFVDTVRATGGRNRDRWLVVQGYNTDIDTTVKHNASMPKDTTPNRLMMEVHFYSPYNFTLNENSEIWQWGKEANDPAHKDTWGDEEHVDAQFAKIQASFVSKGIPVLLGEYGSGLKPKFPGMEPYRERWIEYVTGSAFRHGLVPMYWDTGGELGLLARSDGAVQHAGLIRRMLDACR